jgi:ketosteroid isomerase-like protein
MSASAFDYPAYRAALEAKDVPAWLAFYADDAEWVELRHDNPPRSPNVMRGHGEIGAFLERVAQMPVGLALGREVLGDERIAFEVTCDMGDGRRIVENVICDVRDGQIVRQVDVEAWD